MLNNMGLGFVLQARDTASPVIKKLHGNLESLKKVGESSSSSITEAIGVSTGAILGMTAVVGTALVGAAFEFAEHAERFSSAITQAGVASHATVEELKGLEELARGKSMDSLRGSAIGMAEALRDLAKEGFNAQEAGQALDGTLALMKISMGALGSADAAAVAHDSLRQFSMRADQAGELTDKLAFSMQRFGFQATELRGAMSGLAAGAQLTGASLDDTLIAVGLVHEVFPSASKAAMAMNMAMQQLASTRAQKELRGIGVAVTDNTGKIRPLISIIDELATHTAHMTDGQLAQKLETIAGGRAAGGLSAVIEGLRKGVKDASGQILTGSAAVQFLREQMANTAGTAKRMSDMLGDTMGGAITALKNAISNAGVAIGAGFESPFKNAIQTANLFVRGLTQLFTQGGFTGEVRDAIDKRLGLKGFVIGVFVWAKRLQHEFQSMVEGFQAAFAPFKPILTEIVGLFGQLTQALGLTDQAANDNARTWDGLGAYGNSVGSALGTLAGSVLPLLKSALELVGGAVIALQDTFRSLLPAVTALWQGIKGVFGMIGGLLTGDWKMLWDGAVDVVVGAAKAIVQLLLGAMGSIAGLLDSVGSAMGQDFGFKNSIAGMQDAMNSGAVERGTSVIKNLVSPSAVAVAATNSQNQAADIRAAKFGGGVASPAAAGDQHVHVSVPLIVDGEKLAHAHATAKRSRDSRAYHAVPAGAEGY